MDDFGFSAELWRWPSQDAWHFVTVPADVSEAIRLSAGPPKSFGSVRVEVVVGGTRWRTSVFPDSGSGTYVLPMKRAVRLAEDLEAGDLVTVTLRLLTG